MIITIIVVVVAVIFSVFIVIFRQKSMVAVALVPEVSDPTQSESARTCGTWGSPGPS